MNAIQLTQCYCHHERAEGRMELVESDASVRPAEQREDGREMVVTAACSVLVVGTTTRMVGAACAEKKRCFHRG